MDDADRDEFERLLDRYDRCFHERDPAALRALYADDGAIVYFDNHAACDATDLEAHLAQVAAFFETGEVVPLLRQGLRAQRWGDGACLTMRLRYSTRPRPAVRATFVLERRRGEWRIRHVHFSTDPNELEPT